MLVCYFKTPTVKLNEQKRKFNTLGYLTYKFSFFETLVLNPLVFHTLICSRHLDIFFQHLIFLATASLAVVFSRRLCIYRIYFRFRVPSHERFLSAVAGVVEGPAKVMGENLFYLCFTVVQSKREKSVFFFLC